MAKNKKFESAFDNLSMEQIIGAPLKATAHANAMMAREQVKFLMDFCFAKEGDSYFPVMVEMTMSRTEMPSEKSETEMRSYQMKFGLPLLTLLPLNSLSVEEFELDFDMEITSIAASSSNKSSTNDQNRQESQEMKFMGKISNKEQQSGTSRYQRKINSKLSINVKGGQLPLPTGITSIIDLFSKNVNPMRIEQKDELE